MKILHCIGISPGVASGPIHLFDSNKIIIEKNHPGDPAIETARLVKAIEKAQHQLQDAYQKALENTSREIAAIFDAQMMILQDPELNAKTQNLIKTHHFTAEYAWFSTISDYEKMFTSLPVATFAERSADILDVGQRVLRILKDKEITRQPEKPSIIVAEEITPSDAVGFDREMVLGYCTARGGPTSHFAIFARAMGIPAVTGIDPWLPQFRQDMEAIVDGSIGTIILQPDEKAIDKYTRHAIEVRSDFEKALTRADTPAVSLDGYRFAVAANVGSPREAADASGLGAEGVGLLRTEFLFQDRDTPPSEEEQYREYKKIIDLFGQKPVVFRTFDIGGDKPAPYLKIPRESNPFLGLRGTRLALRRENILRTQLRALLRAGAGSNIKIMFPMIGSLNEIIAMKQQMTYSISTLVNDGLEHNPHCEIGLMVEIPSAAILADVLVHEIDFFSIGTNDLTQFTLAADRTNSLVAEYSDGLDPAVLRLIEMVIKPAHQEGKWVGLCGELAGDPAAVPVLMGFHLDEFSMNPRSIPFIKDKIRNTSLYEAEKITTHVLSLSTVSQIRDYLNQLEEV